MEATLTLVLCLVVVVIARWLWLRDRLAELESRIRILESPVSPAPAGAPVEQAVQLAMPAVPPAAPRVSVPFPQPDAAPKAEPLTRPQPEPARETDPAPARDWEAVLGGNWLNKLGVFILVIGIALALGYSFTRVGPAGRVAISLAASAAMLATGVFYESRYTVFARGLIGGGWAALYFTVYAMHAVAAAHVLDSPFLAAVLLFAVAAGMILHSLRYASPTVTGLAYFIAFATLAIADVNAFAVFALLPLSISLLFLARRFQWRAFAVLGLIATYGTIAFRGHTGAPLWQSQMLLAAFWVIFEAFDILIAGAASPVLLPLNAAGALGLSLLSWQHSAPDDLWRLAAGAAVAYLGSAILRRRHDSCILAAIAAAILGAAAILLRLDHQWTAFALLLEAEAFYAAGLGRRAPWLRHIGSGLFVVQLARLLAIDVPNLPIDAWVPIAALDAAVFYANSFRDRIYGYVGAAMVALIAGFKAPHDDRGLAWIAIASALFSIGWLRRRADLRIQAYALALLGIVGMVVAHYEPRLSLALAAAAFYAVALCARFGDPARFEPDEADVLRFGGAAAAAGFAAALLWRTVPDLYRGVAWMGIAVLLLELGIRKLPEDLRRIAFAVAVTGAVLVGYTNLLDLPLHNSPWEQRMIPLYAAILAWTVALRACESLDVASFIGTGFLAAGLWSVLPDHTVAPAWAAFAAALSWIPGRRASFQLQAALLAAAAFLAAIPESEPILTAAAVILLLFLSRGQWYALVATALLSITLYLRVSGSVLTIALAAQGIALLSAGLTLRHRVLRLSGLALLLFCILKAFVYDLRYLETLPRIFSFIVLGLILVGVSWLYARFRDRLQRLL